MGMGNRPIFSKEAKLQWAGSRDRNLDLRSRQNFFLTSLFIELIDLARSEKLAINRHKNSGI
jgi:hypothetical protein